MRRLFAYPFVTILAVILLAACSGAQSSGAQSSGAQSSGAQGSGGRGGGLSIKEAWARPGQANGTTAVYFVIDNTGGQADTLTGAQCAAAEACELHMTQMDAAGIMKMVHQGEVPVPAGEQVAFQPGGMHVMVMGLKNDLKAYETFSLTLSFKTAGAISVEAEVKEP